MKENEYGTRLDRNGYAPSVVESDQTRCMLCGKRNCKMDRHEPFNGPLREKSKRLGMWVLICHECHQGTDGAHSSGSKARKLKAITQYSAMKHYGWSMQDWHRMFGKSFLDEIDL